MRTCVIHAQLTVYNVNLNKFVTNVFLVLKQYSINRGIMLPSPTVLKSVGMARDFSMIVMMEIKLVETAVVNLVKYKVGSLVKEVQVSKQMFVC